jgi:hypothetical protein
MHGPATPPGTSLFPAIDLGHQSLEISSLGQKVAMRPVVAKDIIFFIQTRANPHGNRLLTGAEMAGCMDLTSQDGIDKTFLAKANPEHGPVQKFWEPRLINHYILRGMHNRLLENDYLEG